MATWLREYSAKQIMKAKTQYDNLFQKCKISLCLNKSILKPFPLSTFSMLETIKEARLFEMFEVFFHILKCITSLDISMHITNLLICH